MLHKKLEISEYEKELIDKVKTKLSKRTERTPSVPTAKKFTRSKEETLNSPLLQQIFKNLGIKVK